LSAYLGNSIQIRRERPMPDTPVDRPEPSPYDPGHEGRISRLEDEMRDVKATLAQMLPILVRIDSTLTATLPHLATKAEMADLRGEIKAEVADLRGELKAEIGDLRGEVTTQIASVRAEIAGLRTAGQADFASVKSELAVIRTDMAHLATKAELAEKPSKAYLWGVLAALIATYATGLAGLAVLLR
jgi:hypothetical protein